MFKKTFTLLFLISIFSVSSADISHPNNPTAQACYTAHNDIHFFTAPAGCASFSNGYVGSILLGNTCSGNGGATVVTPGGSYCLVTDSLGNFWSIQLGLTTEAGLAPCTSSAQFNPSSGCIAAPPTSVPTLNTFGFILLLLTLLWFGRSRLRY